MDMGFNIYAMAKPETLEEYGALLDEALRLMDELNEQLLKIEEELHKKFPGRR